MAFVERFIVYAVVVIGLPVFLLALAMGPARLWGKIKQGWNRLYRKKLDPEEILTQVVRQHEAHVTAVRKVIAQAEAAEAEIQRNVTNSEENIRSLEREARTQTAAGDELGARAALFKLNLERAATTTFKDQLQRHHALIGESRRRLYLLELQLRQFEVGRSILLSQLAQAEKVEQQYAIASQFDPFNAVANWQQAEGMVQEKDLNARAIERVYTDTTELAAGGQALPVDPALLDTQLAELRAALARAGVPQAALDTAVGQPAASQEPNHKPKVKELDR